MNRLCEYCDAPILDGAEVCFIATGQFKSSGPVPNSYGIGQNFRIDNLYHPECLDYVMGGGR